MEKTVFDRDLSAKVMTTALDSATTGVLAGLKAVSLAHEQSIRSASVLLEQAQALAKQNRELSEELISNAKKYTSELQRLYLDAWGQWADAVRPEAASTEKKKA